MTSSHKPIPDKHSPGAELLAWNLRKFRVAAGLSQDQLGENADVDRTYVSRLERAIENPSLAIIDRLAAALGIQISELVGVPGPTEPAPRPMTAGRKVGYRRQNPAQ